MSGRYNLVKEFIIKPIKNLVKGKKTSKTITSTPPNVGNLKFNQDIKNKLIKITDAYVTKAGSVDPGLKKALRDAGSKSLQGDKIVRKRNKKSKEMFKTAEGKKDGGRMGLKFGGGADMGKKPISRSKNPGLLAMSKTAKGKEAVKKMKFNPNRIVAKKGGKA